MKNIKVECPCDGIGYIPVQAPGGEDVDFVECAEHHPAYEPYSTDELLAYLSGKPGSIL